jgi:hypothetical protein
VVTDAVAELMLADLGEIGVTGLALVPEAMRHVFSYGEPLLTPADFEGITIRTPTSETAFALFEALGALPDDFGGIGGGELSAAIADGRVDAMESSFGGFISDSPASRTAANVVPYPKANTLVVNSEVLGGLTGEQQEALLRAATETRDWAVTNNLDDVSRAATYCSDGGTIVTASPSDLAALQRAAQPVYADLERDPATARTIERIRELANAAGPGEPVTPCGAAAVATTSPATPTDAAAAVFPNGVFRAERSVDDLLAAGVDQLNAFDHDGTWTLTFDDGRVIIDNAGLCHGRYEVADERLTVTLGDDPACGDAVDEVLFSAGWQLEGDELQFVDVRSGHGYDVLIAALFGGAPFIRID